MRHSTRICIALAFSGSIGAAGVVAVLGSPATTTRTDRVEVPAEAMQDTSLDPVRQAISRVDGTLGGLTGSQAEQQLRMAALEQRIAALAEKVAEQKPSPESDPVPESEVDAARAPRERFERLTQRVAAEPRDEEWSRGAERHLTDVFQREELQASHLARIDCRSTLCAATIRHDDESSREAFLEAFPQAVGWSSDGQVQLHAEDGVITTELVFTRDGVAMPEISDRG